MNEMHHFVGSTVEHLHLIFYVISNLKKSAESLSLCGGNTRSRRWRLGSPIIKAQVLTQCIPAVTNPTYCFSAWPPAP